VTADVYRVRNLYSTFITPWADQSAAHTVEPDYHIPACYNVPSAIPGPSKAQAFSDETLFFMFYSSPRDALQEVAAQELFVAGFLSCWVPLTAAIDGIVTGDSTKSSDYG
jgi:CCR4-NOT transcription complex subunit 2